MKIEYKLSEGNIEDLQKKICELKQEYANLK